ncbi:patched domain-containing protein 3-like [Mizuhopecten yessoensis]|uniref:Patched domain-containing protein 3 n=1 Tax=Mizuhopecten yessoensis TaxID=6573 RepID=A0A210QRK5_MIZYE|nr:patched domain-containing protein 3-like [Mizuhopecten yessoensis]OWF51349.1 Patched domain-containing protein 3 [Mizuhopecten yessoensis]
MSFTTFYKHHEERLGRVFEIYGRLVSRYPMVIIAVCLSINCLLFGIGILYLESETDTEVLYTPRGARVYHDKARLDKLFKDKSGSNFYPHGIVGLNKECHVIVQTKDGSNILTPSYMEEVKRVDTFVRNISQLKNTTTSTFSDVCALRNGACVASGDFLFTAKFNKHILAENVSFPIFSRKVISTTFGNVKSANGTLDFSSMIFLRYYLRQDTTEASVRSAHWERAFIDVMTSFDSATVSIAYTASLSKDEELSKNISGDLKFFALTILIMLVYASCATSGGNCVSERQNLGRASVLATCLAIASSLGLLSALGVKYVEIAGIMPFLVLGIGLDDMFILMSCLADAEVKGSIEERIMHTMRTGGVAITITSVTDFLAFAIGATSVFLGVQNFCLFTGTAIIFCYLNQLAFFMPCMVINERRVTAGRHCGTCLRTKSRQELVADGHSKCFALCCGGEAPRKRSDNEGPLESLPKLVLQKALTNVVFKVCTIIVFIGYLSAAVYGCVNLKEGLLLSNIVDKSSYYHTYAKLIEDDFSVEIPVAFTFTSPQSYHDPTLQQKITDMLATARRDRLVNSDIEINWLSDYRASPLYQGTNESEFVSGLKQFLSVRPDHANDVILDDTGNKIKASRLYVISNDVTSTTDQGEMMTNVRRIADNFEIPLMAYSYWFFDFEQFAAILPNTLKTMGIAIVVICVMTILFMPHPFLIACVTVTMTTILLGVCGFMYYWDMTLSTVTMVELIMCIGFSVDSSAHMCHAFITVEGNTRAARVHAALERAGGPVLNAALSSIIGVTLLIFSSSYIFRTFFKMMILVFLFGLAHAIFLLPIIFSKFGPISVQDNKEVPESSGQLLTTEQKVVPKI